MEEIQIFIKIVRVLRISVCCRISNMVGPKKQDLWPKIYILKQNKKKKSVDD
jgi:hypothetical protein